jgi:sec-independent protein translocase protein TatA
MGLGGISIWQLLIILVIVVLIFGTKRLKSLGGDLGSAMKSFRKAMENDDEDKGGSEQERKQIGQGEEHDAHFAEEKEEAKERQKEHHG